MSRFLAASLAVIASIVLMFTAYALDPLDPTVSGGAFIALALAIPVFIGAYVLERLGLRKPRTVALVVAAVLCGLTLHAMGLVAWLVLAAFTVAQYALRNSRAFRLRHSA